MTAPPPADLPITGRTAMPRALAREWYAHPQHGSLPILLLLLTLNTGVIDAVSILSLGRVFIANMTDNVVFVGFAAAGVPGFSLSASLWALAGFLAGAYLGGQLIQRISDHRGRLFQVAVLIETVLLAAALVVSSSQVTTCPRSRTTSWPPAPPSASDCRTRSYVGWRCQI